MRISTKTVCDCIASFVTAPAVMAKAEAENKHLLAMAEIVQGEIDGLQASLDGLENALVRDLVTAQIDHKTEAVKAYKANAEAEAVKAEQAKRTAEAVNGLHISVAGIASVFAVFTEYFLRFDKVVSEITDKQGKDYLNSTLLALQSAVVNAEQAEAVKAEQAEQAEAVKAEQAEQAEAVKAKKK